MCICIIMYTPGIKELTKLTTGKLMNGLPQVPPPKSQSSEDLISLPILHQKREIVGAVAANQVVMVCGDTGCGKTTQVYLVNVVSYLNYLNVIYVNRTHSTYKHAYHWTHEGVL